MCIRDRVTTEVKAEEVNKDIPKSIPLAAAKFEPSGLQFAKKVTISIPNPIDVYKRQIRNRCRLS